MLTMYAYVVYAERPAVRRYVLVVVAFALGLMAKPMLVTLPFVFLLLDYWPLRRFHFAHVRSSDNDQMQEMRVPLSPRAGSSPFHLILEKVPLIVLSLVSSVVTVLSQKSGEAITPLNVIGFGTRLINAVTSYIIYIQKTFWPEKLAFFYPYVINLFSPWEIAGAILFITGVTVYVFLKIGRFPYLTVGWLWYLGTLVPVIGLVQVGSQAMADRYTYIPLIGVFIMTVWGIADLLGRWQYGKQCSVLSSATVLVLMTVLTFAQVQTWKNSVAVFEHAIRVTYGNYLAHNNLGVALFHTGKTDEAISHFAKASRIKPDYYDAHKNSGMVMLYQGRMDEAITHYREAVKIKPDLFEARNNLGFALIRRGRYDDAIVEYKEALRINPRSEAVHNNLGVAFVNVGRFHEAMHYFGEALRINPAFTDAKKNLRFVQERLGMRPDGA
ncbi:MAG: tetratricopeptide repeat protein [Deltaproteobacteria bacterium]|nr:tetratricopeptide repeat protein [Deltaproteobacteria bacterium]